MTTMLIVEDELKTGTYLKQGLLEAGYDVTLVNDGRQGLEHILRQHYDLIILDVMLPSMDGWDILQQMRMARHEEPVLFLTARDNVSEKIKGLDLGADDAGWHQRRRRDEVGSVLARDRQPGQPAGQLSGRHHDDGRDQRQRRGAVGKIPPEQERRRHQIKQLHQGLRD